MVKKKVMALLMVSTLTLAVGLTGCSSSTASSSSSVSTEASSEEGSEEAESAYGQITAIDGDTITLTSQGAFGGQGGEAPNGEMPEGEAPVGNGEAPEKPDGESESADGETPEKPEDADNSDSDDTAADDASEENADDADSSDDTEDGEDTEEAPEMPDGESGEAPDGEMPEGEAPDDLPEGGEGEGQPGGMGEEITITVTDSTSYTAEDGSEITLDDLSVEDYITVTYDSDGNAASIVVGQQVMQMGGGDMGGGQSSGVDSYDAAAEITEDTTSDGESYDSTGTDENTILNASGATASISNATITKTSDDSTGGDNSSFYGVGAAVLTTDGTTIIKDSTITTDSAGGAGVFSYGDGITYVSDTTITTEQDTSGGIHVAGGGTLYAWNVTATTSGTSSAAIRSDRGSGTMVVDGGTYTSNGADSPAVYCTADIAINDSTLTANGAEGVCIEGLNSLHIYDSDLTSSMTSDERNELVWNIIVYQSMSGDSEEGNGTFSMMDGSITFNEGGLFYTTNTESTFYLNNVTINYPEETDFFLRVTGNSNERGWGTAGENGADTTFTADDQDMEGDIITDSISNLDFYMENGSTLKGAFIQDESNAGNGGSGETNVYISSDSTWTVTGDSIITNLYNEGTIVDESGNTVTIVDADGNTLVEGTSEYTITVNNYEETADFSGASTATSFDDYAVEQQ